MSNFENVIVKIRKEMDDNLQVFSDSSIEYGKMGAAIFYYYCQKYFDDNKFLKSGESLIEQSIDLLSSISITNGNNLKFKGDSIGAKLSSFGKGLLFIQNNFNLQYDFSENYLYLNDVLFETTKQSINRKDYDYFSGSLSSGYYFLNNFNHNQDFDSKQILNLIVNSIIKDAVFFNKDEIYWISPTYNNKIYLGLSHGSAMIINFLTKILNDNIYEGDKEELICVIYKAVNFLIKRERNYLNGFFPHQFSIPEGNNETQFSMCYGDLGILYAIHSASKLFNFYEFYERIEYLLFSTSKRKLNKAFTQDASILYGCSGLYYIYKDLYIKTSNNLYLESSKYWHKNIFYFNNPIKKSLAGFQFEYEGLSEVDKSARYSFYWGIGGIGITLMQESSDTLPNLNELLLI